MRCFVYVILKDRKKSRKSKLIFLALETCNIVFFGDKKWTYHVAKGVAMVKNYYLLNFGAKL